MVFSQVISVSLCLVLLSCSYVSTYDAPRLQMERLSFKPIISKWNNDSIFLYNYNSAYMPSIDNPDDVALLVRVQDLLPNATSIYEVGPSKIAVSRRVGSDNLKFTYISENDVIIDPADQPYQSTGAEDPRIVLYESTYYLLYTAVSKTESGNWRAQLALATCQVDCMTKTNSNWQYHGPLFPDVFWTKSGSLLIHNTTHRYLFFNDSNIAIAKTTDLLNYTLTHDSLLTTRSDHFDSELVEAGPQPLKMSDNNYLFLYNSARKTDIKNPKPGWNLEYNLGWAILDGEDPTKVLARSDEPLFSPELDWEKCDNSSSEWAARGLTPLVIFVEGWKKTAENTFLVWYQGCDSTMGVAQLKVSFSRGSITAPVLVYLVILLSSAHVIIRFFSTGL